jgi:hypothetical protein
VTINNNAELYEFCNCNEYNLNLLTRTNWRASLVPAAAVIPAPIAYIKVVAVKKLVVELWVWFDGLPMGSTIRLNLSFWQTIVLLIGCGREPGLLL